MSPGATSLFFNRASSASPSVLKRGMNNTMNITPFDDSPTKHSGVLGRTFLMPTITYKIKEEGRLEKALIIKRKNTIQIN